MSAIRNIENQNELQTIYDQSQSTIMGAGGDLNEWLDGINEWLKENDFGHIDTMTTYLGKDVNEFFGLKGNYRFPDDLVFISWPNAGIKNMNQYCLARFNMGIRWFDDIVDNSRIKDNDD